MRSRIEPVKKFARTVRAHRELLLKTIRSGQRQKAIRPLPAEHLFTMVMGSLRLLVPPGLVSFLDRIQGHLEQDIAAEVGDFVLRRADRVHAYQLAVVVDDAWQGITNVVRADIRRESGDLIFQPATVPGDYYAYYLPYNPGVGNFDDPGTYFAPEDTADAAWLARFMPRVLAVDDFQFEMSPDGTIMIIFNDDRPGVIGSVGRYCDKMTRRSNINPGSVRKRQLKLPLASGHSILHHHQRNAAPEWVRRCTHSFKRDARCHGLTNIADVTQDHANHRASYAPVLLRSSPARHSTLTLRAASSFLYHSYPHPGGLLC